MQIDCLLNNVINSWLLQHSYSTTHDSTKSEIGTSFYSSKENPVFPLHSPLLNNPKKKKKKRQMPAWCNHVSHQFGTIAIKQSCKKNERRTSRIFISFQDCLSWCASQKLFSSPKLTWSNDYLISIAAVFSTSMFCREFITPYTSVDEEKANNDWFFLSGLQNEMESPNSSIRKPLISLFLRSALSSWLIMSLMSDSENPLPWSIINFMKEK